MACLCAAFAPLLPLLACGPFFPNSLLLGGDLALLAAPMSDFERELQSVQWTVAQFRAVTSTNGFAAQTFDAELSELRSALRETEPAPANVEEVVTQFERTRSTLRDHALALQQWREHSQFRETTESGTAPPLLGPVFIPVGLPAEFRQYLAGSVAFHAGDTNSARVAWEKLLLLPGEERQYRSTWAAFMLGKVLLETDPRAATRYFEQVRELAGAGFKDSLGLAASSYGWQAKAEVNTGHDASALQLYLVQYRTGDRTALVSLRMTLRDILSNAEFPLDALAANPILQQLVTAYLVSRRGLADAFWPDDGPALLQRWLVAVERAGPPEVAPTEALALAAYQAGQFELAAGWLARASAHSGMAQWLRAKLFLRAGKVDEAAKLLSGVCRLFAREASQPQNQTSLLAANWGWDSASRLQQSMGERGVLHLVRREYYEALDTLLRSGYWTDAAYIAEYVLTVDELMAYTDRQWAAPDSIEQPSVSPPSSDLESEQPNTEESIRRNLRYLVARRLARLERWEEAQDFYPSKWVAAIQQFALDLRSGRDVTLPANQRAAALWSAAQVARIEGMELFGTEVEPDWQMFGGQYERQSISELRSQADLPNRDGSIAHEEYGSVSLKISASSSDERRRTSQHQLVPAPRFHYRYKAADLAWEAAQQMTDQSDETARVLWQAGTWLKARDPEAADRFYKALVRRCGQTPLGREADRLRWFPKSDVIPTTVEEQPEEAEPGSESLEPEPAEASDMEDAASGESEFSG